MIRMKFNPWRALILVAGVCIAILYYRYRQPRFVAGETAPDFEVTLSDGRQGRLSDLKGKYVLLQFWGSWCGPCRAENPYLLELYHKFHARGFDIFSVAIEQTPARWQQAIAADGMEWTYHAAEFERFKGPVAQLYNIHSIPMTFLINPSGVIMGVNRPPDEIDRLLTAALADR